LSILWHHFFHPPTSHILDPPTSHLFGPLSSHHVVHQHPISTLGHPSCLSNNPFWWCPPAFHHDGWVLWNPFLFVLGHPISLRLQPCSLFGIATLGRWHILQHVWLGGRCCILQHVWLGGRCCILQHVWLGG
jgi:hypothetical protein